VRVVLPPRPYALAPALAFMSALAPALDCAPLGELRPGSMMMPGRSSEIGAGLVHVGPRTPYVEESPANVGMLWASRDATRAINVSLVSAFDRNALAIGAALRVNALRYDRFAGGLELQLGHAWGALVLPVAVRLHDQTWVYTSPRFGTIGRDPSFGVPVGLSVRVWSGLALRGELQSSWQDFRYYNRRLHSALGVAWEW
jgi:hypothetical protein